MFIFTRPEPSTTDRLWQEVPHLTGPCSLFVRPLPPQNGEAEGEAPLSASFFAPFDLYKEGRLEQVLLGLTGSQASQGDSITEQLTDGTDRGRARVRERERDRKRELEREREG